MRRDLAVFVAQEYLPGFMTHAFGPQPATEGVFQIMDPDLWQSSLLPSPAPEGSGNTDCAIAGATKQSAAWDTAAFRREGIQLTTPVARKPVKTTWHERLRAFVQN